MVTQAPKKMAVFAALAFSLSCIGLIIFVWTQFGGSIPLAPQGYRLKALFTETGLLVPNADVRISGVNVGKVVDVQPKGVDSLVTMNIDSTYAPMPVDTRAILREKTLLGEAYVALSTGSGSGPKFKDGGTIPNTHVEKTQQLDQVLDSFNPQTQHNLQALLNGTGAALAGQGQNLNDAVGNYDPLVTDAAAIVGVLNAQQSNLRSLIANGATIFNTLGDRSSDLRTLVTSGDQVLSATAQRNVALTDTVNGLPPFLEQLRTTLRGLNTTLGLAKPSLVALRPVAPLLTPALREVSAVTKPGLSLIHAAPGLLKSARVALPAIADFGKAFKPSVDALLPAAENIVPIIDYMYQDRGNLVAAMSNLAATLQGTAPAATPSGYAHYIRAVLSIGNESIFGQSVRTPTNRSNAYYAPGELNDTPTGLKSASCANTKNSAQVPIPLLGNVPCVVQAPFAWGNGIGTAYYPRLTATPAK
jgi:phospholipid/cholesterol/gamma-HCH transport system substrate-binding protein